MKKIFALLSLSVLLFSCTSSGPKKTAKNFMENLSKGKVEEAKKYATEPTAKVIDMMSAFGGFPIEPNFKFEALKDSIVENRAWVTFKDQDGDEETLELVKLDGKWLVHMEGK